MAKKRYSRQELYILRNHIPVDSLIENLGIGSKMSKGCFRFCCPVCREFDTGIKSTTNLARCFACEKNYNAIDLVMLVKGSDFTRSVEFLKTIYEQKKDPAPTLSSTKRVGTSQPVVIGNILKTMEPALKSRTRRPSKPTTNKLTLEMLHDRVLQLEHQVNHLTQKITAIALKR